MTMKPFSEISCYAIEHGEDGGSFRLGGMNVIASWSGGWDHVSVSRTDRCPTWDEMERVKRAFFRPEEVAMQLHVAEMDHINKHPYCLHLWRSHKWVIPMPPKWMVG